MRIVELLQPIGEADLELVNAARKLRGMPPSEMVWVCQHSCAPESIPGCQDFNCEATLIVDRWDIEDIRGLVARGELAAFDGVNVRLRLDVPDNVGIELQQFADASLEQPAVARQGELFESSGSLLAFARLCARCFEPGLSDQTRELLLEIERVLTWQFSGGGPALFQQRFVDTRSRRSERGNTITLLARADWPARALVGWEEPPLRQRRGKADPSPVPQANAGFGLWSETGKGMRLDRTTSGLAAIPGDLYGPWARLVFRVDQEVADRVRELCAALVTAPEEAAQDTAMLELLTAITRELGLSAPALPPPSGKQATACVRSAQFIRRLLLAQPYPHVSAGSPPI